MTIDVFLKTDADYALVADEGFLTPALISRLYRVEAESVRIFRLPALRVVKVSFPRRVPQGSINDRDMHAAHQFMPLASVGVAAPDAPVLQG